MKTAIALVVVVATAIAFLAAGWARSDVANKPAPNAATQEHDFGDKTLVAFIKVGSGASASCFEKAQVRALGDQYFLTGNLSNDLGKPAGPRLWIRLSDVVQISEHASQKAAHAFRAEIDGKGGK